MTYTYTTYEEFGYKGKELPPLPSSKDEQIRLLGRAVYDLTNWLMDELGWDNPSSIADRLADEVNRIAQRAYEYNAELDDSE